LKLLLDTHLLLWAAEDSPSLSLVAQTLIEDKANELHFSLISIWEMAIKHSLQRPDFVAHPRRVHEGLLQAGYRELSIKPEHVFAVTTLPSIHRDPFDRLLAAQAAVEGLVLLTSDFDLSQYPSTKRV
jgi:PIN domain nuclease of toxin-antitoxin system